MLSSMIIGLLAFLWLERQLRDWYDRIEVITSNSCSWFLVRTLLSVSRILQSSYLKGIAEVLLNHSWDTTWKSALMEKTNSVIIYYTDSFVLKKATTYSVTLDCLSENLVWPCTSPYFWEKFEVLKPPQTYIHICRRILSHLLHGIWILVVTETSYILKGLLKNPAQVFYECYSFLYHLNVQEAYVYIHCKRCVCSGHSWQKC